MAEHFFREHEKSVIIGDRSVRNRINSLDELLNMGLYLNDLNPHGMSKELVLAGWQHCGRYGKERILNRLRNLVSRKIE